MLAFMAIVGGLTLGWFIFELFQLFLKDKTRCPFCTRKRIRMFTGGKKETWVCLRCNALFKENHFC